MSAVGTLYNTTPYYIIGWPARADHREGCFRVGFGFSLGVRAQTEGGGPGEAELCRSGKPEASRPLWLGGDGLSRSWGGRGFAGWVSYGFCLRQGGTRCPAPTVPLQRGAPTKHAMLDGLGERSTRAGRTHTEESQPSRAE